MADKFLNQTGLSYYHNRLKTLFASVDDIPENTSDLTNDGDGQSPFATEAYVDENGGKIDVIKVNGTTQTITNKEVNLEVAVVKEALDPDEEHDQISIEQGSRGMFFNKEDYGLSVMGHGSSYQVFWKQLVDKNYVDTNAGKIDVIKVNGTTQTITNKAVDITVPTKTSDITNDSDYQNETEVQALIDASLADITGIDFQIVATLPDTGEKGVIYLVPEGSVVEPPYDEYIWITPETGDPYFEKIGDTTVDLTNYWRGEAGHNNSLIAITTAEIDTLFA